MAKDVNIHVKTDGTPQVQRDLDGVAQSANKVGENVEQMGSRSSRAMDWFASGLKSLAGAAIRHNLSVNSEWYHCCHRMLLS